MSPESRRLIKSMLQVDPKKRITIEELLSHPWLTLGILDPVDYTSTDIKKYDRDCVNVMASYYDMDPEKMWQHLKKWNYDYHTATYSLLLAKKKRGSSLKLNSLPGPIYLKMRLEETPRKLKPLQIVQAKDALEETPKNKFESPITPYFDCQGDIENLSPLSVVREFVEPTKPSAIRKPLKRLRSRTLSGESSPVPSKKLTTERSTPKTPERKRTPVSSETPGSARRVLGSIERSLYKVRHVLTPKKSSGDASTQPVLLSSKNLCNVSTTQCSDPEHVIRELCTAFQRKGFECIRKGFVLRGKVEANVLHSCSGCSFELEICYLPCMGPLTSTAQVMNTPPRSILKNGPLNFNTPTNGNSPASTPSSLKKRDKRIDLLSKEKHFAFVGIRRKRLKGDSWCYKKVCEEVLAVTTKDLKTITESAV